jgi:hypothetical protein|tara:strand:- start:8757 stop:10736 length:1980 start_codon:yes stop_codon:yes gene_type:complete
MMMILKGHGGYLIGSAMDQYGMQQVPSPGEIGDDLNPFHHFYNPETGKVEEFTGPNVIKKNTYQALVDATLRSIIHQKPQLISQKEKIRKRLREIVNESAHKWNILTDKKTEEGQTHHKPGWRGPDAFPDVVFRDTNDHNSVNPELRSGGFAPKYVSMVTEKHPDGNWNQGKKGQRLLPHQVPVRRKDGKIPEFVSSNADHMQSGHMSEGGYVPIMSVYLDEVRKEFDIRTPKSLQAGHVDGGEYTWFVDDNGEEHPAYAVYRQNNPPDGGRAKVTNRAAIHGPHQMDRALASLDPMFFAPVHLGAKGDHGRLPNGEEGPRHRFARNLLAGELWQHHMEGSLDEKLVDDFSKSYIVNVMYHSQEQYESGKSANQSGIKAGTRSGQLLNKYKDALGIPLTESDAKRNGMQGPLWARFKEANHNAGNMGVNTDFGGDGHKSNPKGRGGINWALYVTLEAQREQGHAGRVHQVMNEAYTPSQVEAGKTLRNLFNRNWRQNVPISNEEVVLAPPEAVPEPNPRFSPRVDTGEWLRSDQAGGGTGQEKRGEIDGAGSMRSFEPRQAYGAEGSNTQTGFDRLSDIMESLQSADARMDNIILKALPAKRRFDIGDTIDCHILCDNYDIEVRDLHYINNSTGDWSRLADDLKVDASIVKGVKIALRW